MTRADTIAAVATAPGRGGVAVVRVSGSEAFSVLSRLTGGANRERPLCVRRIHDPSASEPTVVDEAIVLTFRAPHSYTGEDVVEIQCHGGSVTPRRVLEACFAAGARLARRGEFTERAFLNGRIDYDQAEAVLHLIDAKTSRAADAALAGLSGSKRRERVRLYETALDLSVRMEYALDVSEEELPDDFLPGMRASVEALRTSIREALTHASEGRLLREGALVVLAGPPNVGKSSLMNALLEENRAIVSDVPGTTRDSIEEWMDLDGWPIRLVDTAGIRETSDSIEAEGVRRSEDLIARAEIVVCLGAADWASCDRARAIVVHPKCDLGRGEGLNVSALTGEGLGELKRCIVEKLQSLVKVSDGQWSSSGDVSALSEALSLLPSDETFGSSTDLVLAANALRRVSECLGTLVGAVYSADLLDNLFSRFCIGK